MQLSCLSLTDWLTKAAELYQKKCREEESSVQFLSVGLSFFALKMVRTIKAKEDKFYNFMEAQKKKKTLGKEKDKVRTKQCCLCLRLRVAPY
jgi:hypothetical protein